MIIRSSNGRCLLSSYMVLVISNHRISTNLLPYKLLVNMTLGKEEGEIEVLYE